MSLAARQQQILDGMETALQAGETRLTSMFAIFTRLGQGRRNTRDGRAGSPVPAAAELAEGVVEAPHPWNAWWRSTSRARWDKRQAAKASRDHADPARARSHRLRGAPWREHGQRALVQAGERRAHLRACAQPGQDLPAIAAGAGAKARPLTTPLSDQRQSQ